jgi:hypothetical protein
LDGNILIVTCAAAQSWFMGEIVDGKKWDGEKKVLYEVKGLYTMHPGQKEEKPSQRIRQSTV